MMDYYSQFEGPGPEERREDIVRWVANSSGEAMKTWLEEHSAEIEKMAEEVAAESKGYSISGYAVFGRKENEKKMSEQMLARYPELRWADGRFYLGRAPGHVAQVIGLFNN